VTLGNGRVTTAIASPDGKWAAYVLVPGDGSTYQTFLVNVVAETTTKVAETVGVVGIAPIAFSPDGMLLATTESVMIQGAPFPNQLKVIATADGKPAAWAAQPTQTASTALAFSDGDTLYLHAQSIIGDTGLWKTTATTAKWISMTGGNFEIAASRWLLFATNPAKGVEGISLLDLQAATPSATVIATATGALPTISDDAKLLRLLEDYDPTTRTGDLVAVSLDSPSRPTLVAPQIDLGANAFAAGTGKLLYIRQGALYEWDAGSSSVLYDRVYNWRTRGAPSTLYFADAAAIYQVPLN
jgi:hypothetical protein